MLDRPTLTGSQPDAGLKRLDGLVQTFHDYLAMTKPPIVVLLLFTAIGGMFLAAQAVPPWHIALLVCLGGALGAGGANALNHYLDQDIDEKMSRTAQRPLPGNRIAPRNALIFGIVLNVAAFLILGAWVNLLAAFLTLAATLFYVMHAGSQHFDVVRLVGEVRTNRGLGVNAWGHHRHDGHTRVQAHRAKTGSKNSQ